MDNSNFFIDENNYSKQDLFRVLDDNEINSLIARRIVLKVGVQSYKFQFVGVISCRKNPLYIFPKTYRVQDLSNKLLEQSIQSLKSYVNSNEQRYDGVDYFESDADNLECSEMSIAKFLMDDFERNGLISYREELFEVDGEGYTDWSRTIAFTDPIFNNNNPIYYETVNNVVREDCENVTILIHKKFLKEMVDKYHVFLAREHFSVDFNESELSLTNDQMLGHLENELRITYTDREIHILKSLIFLLKKRNRKETDSISLYGTKRYENIWEHICRKVLRDVYNELKESYKLFPKPVWNITGGNPEGYPRSSDLRPDIIVVNSKIAYLFDAKYYNLKFEGGIKDEPGYKDVLKQFLYQQHLEEKLRDIEKLVDVVYNAFLFPISQSQFNSLQKRGIYKSSELVIEIGGVNYSLYSDSSIKVLLCNLDKMKKLYVLGKSLTMNKFLT